MSSTLPKYVQAGQDSAARSATSSAGSQHQQDNNPRRQKCREFIDTYKSLPGDFLRIPASYYPAQQDLSLIPAAQHGTVLHANVGPMVDMIDISVVEAQLVKNYGLLRMDLYCKIRVGHYVAETATCQNGARNPRWDSSGVYQFALKPGIDSFHLEIYDEKQFSSDEKIAWLHEPIPPEIYQGVTVERWFPLSGRLGPQKEGSILLVLSHKRVPLRASNFGRLMMHPHSSESIPMFMPPGGQPHIIGGGSVMPVDPTVHAHSQPPPPPPSSPHVHATQQQQQQQQQQLQQQLQQHPQGSAMELRPASEEDINQLAEMFPSIDKSIIKSVLENHNMDKESAISALLAMG